MAKKKKKLKVKRKTSRKLSVHIGQDEYLRVVEHLNVIEERTFEIKRILRKFQGIKHG